MAFHRRGNAHRARTVSRTERKKRDEVADLKAQKADLLKKAECELKSYICSGEGVRKYKGVKDGDPKFFACLACKAWYGHRGVRMIETSE